MATKIMVTTKEKWDQRRWIKYVNDGLTNAAESVIQAGIRMHEFKTQAKCCKGGSEFGRIAQDKFGMSPSMSSRWATIGENSAKLLVATKNLPESMETVYLISTLSEEQIEKGIEEGIITHEATQKDIKELKKPDSTPSPRQPKPQESPGPNGDEEEEWEKLSKKYGENLATAVWDEIISEEEAVKIQKNEVNIKRMAKKLYGDKDDPNMLPSQVASILGLDQSEVDTILGIKKHVPKTQQGKKFFFEVTPDVVALKSELENPTDINAMRSEKARELYEHFKSIVEMWKEILDR